MHSVVPRYTLPPIMNALNPGSISGLRKTVNPKAATGATSGTTSNSSADGGLGTTFLNLLSTELQNQDPTAPVDSTAMVGQMISLNQLDQLISINQTLSAVSTAAPAASIRAAAAAPAATAAGAISPPPVNANTNQLPFNPETLMPVNPALYPTPFDPSSTSNDTLGGK